jgi:hypothetical protein
MPCSGAELAWAGALGIWRALAAALITPARQIAERNETHLCVIKKIVTESRKTAGQDMVAKVTVEAALRAVQEPLAWRAS